MVVVHPVAIVTDVDIGEGGRQECFLAPHPLHKMSSIRRGPLFLHSPLVGLPACIPMTVDRPVSFVPGIDWTRTFPFHSVVTVVDTMGSVAHNTPPRDPQTL